MPRMIGRYPALRNVLGGDLDTRLDLGQRRQDMIDHLLARRLVPVARGSDLVVDPRDTTG
jgi:hypothetical protein